MNFNARMLDLDAGGKYIVVMSEEEASKLGVHSNDRLKIRAHGREVIAILNTAKEYEAETLGVFRPLKPCLDLEEGDSIEVEPVERPESLKYIRGKIMGERLTPERIESIVADVVERHLSDIELAAFVTSLQIHGTSLEEVEALSRSMIKMGKSISFKRPPILDKHSIGGVPGDKTTLLVVPIVSAAGYTIPKSSSRAITSPAGTADRMEVLCDVELTIENIIDVVDRVNACIVWGGTLDLAPADDLFIKIEYPLSIDPLLLPSIMSKKKAMGSTHVVIDIPTGRGAKIKSTDEAQQLAFNFIELGKRLDLKVKCAITEGDQPVGYAVGPLLEAKETLETLKGDGPADLIDKATSIAGILFEMMGESNGKEMAMEILKSGKADEQMRRIIEAQGGDPEITPEDLVPGEEKADIIADRDGQVLWIDNRDIAQIARLAGAPQSHSSGIKLSVKLGDRVEKGDTIMRIHSDNSRKLGEAESLAREIEPVTIGSRRGERMMLMKISEASVAGEKKYIIDR